MLKRVPCAVRLPAGAICTAPQPRLSTCTARTRRWRAKPPTSPAARHGTVVATS